ncbi:MAG TPA: multiheme c-type cytochrome, partial [Polyangiaceae bacterium]|nr:multiheme c-type cytochrome [Polyangiaceae bacterium]
MGLGTSATGCKCGSEPSSATPGAPSLRLYVMSSVAGALEPCGCVKDMLGGADHAAAYIASQTSAAPNRLVLGAGPMLFLNARADAGRDTQVSFKADALADAYKALHLDAWAPGANDWLLGDASLTSLVQRSGATLLAANLKGGAKLERTKLVEISGMKVGFVGVSVPLVLGQAPNGVEATDAAAAAKTALGELKAAGSQLEILLCAMPRGAALRLVDALPGFEVAVLGKPFDEGETNDPPQSPTLIGKTLVVETPNHLQSLGVVDLYVRGQSFDFVDGSGLESAERKAEIGRRLREIKARVEQGGAAADLAVLQKDQATLEAELSKLKDAQPPAQGSFFRYQSVEVTDKLGSDPAVSSHIAAYYQRVNEHNREAYKDLAPVAPAAGEASYVGLEACSKCHESQRKFWNSTSHAAAYATLSSQHKEFNLDCVGCHVTGYGKPGGSTVTHVENLTAVQCEVCHGPGSKHVADVKDKTAIKMPDHGFCASQCHHP